MIKVQTLNTFMCTHIWLIRSNLKFHVPQCLEPPILNFKAKVLFYPKPPEIYELPSEKLSLQKSVLAIQVMESQ